MSHVKEDIGFCTEMRRAERPVMKLKAINSVQKWKLTTRSMPSIEGMNPTVAKQPLW